MSSFFDAVDAKSDAPAEPENFFDAFDAEEEQRTQDALVRTRDVNPTEHAKHLRNADAMQLPVEVVSHPEVSKQIEEDQLRETSLRMSPAAKGWFSDFDNAAVGQNDVGVLEGLNGVGEKIKNFYNDNIVGGTSQFIEHVAKGDDQEVLSKLAFSEMNESLSRDEQATLDQMRIERDTYNEYNPEGDVLDQFTPGGIRDNTGEVLGQIARPLVSSIVGSGAGAAVGAGVGSVLPGPGTVAGAGTGAVVGGKLTFGVEMYQTGAGAMWDELKGLRTKDGEEMDADVRTGASHLAGAMIAGTELFQIQQFSKFLGIKALTKDGIQEAIKDLIKQPTYTDMLKRFGKTVAGGALTEGIEEAVQTFGEEMIKLGAMEVDGGDFERPTWGEIGDNVLNAWAKGTAGGGGLAGGIATPRAASDARRASQAEAQKQTFQELHDLSEQSVTKQEAPERFQQFMLGVGEEHEIDGVHVDANKLVELFQARGGSLADVAAVLPSVGNQLESAVAANATVEITFEEFTTRIAGTELFAEIENDIKLNADAFTFNEALEFERNAARDLEIDLQTLVDDGQVLEGSGDSATRITTELTEQAVAQGIDAGQASAWGQLHANVFQSFADRMGVDAYDLYTQRNVQVSTDVTRARDRARDFEQSPPAASGATLNRTPVAGLDTQRPVSLNSAGTPGVQLKPKELAFFEEAFQNPEAVQEAIPGIQFENGVLSVPDSSIPNLQAAINGAYIADGAQRVPKSLRSHEFGRDFARVNEQYANAVVEELFQGPPRPKHERKSDKTYKGGPWWINSPGKLSQVRRDIKQLAYEGIVGREWYEDSAQAMWDLAKGDARDVEKLAQLMAIYSPNAQVFGNTMWAIKAYNFWKVGGKREDFNVRAFGRKTPEDEVGVGNVKGNLDEKAIAVLYDDKNWEGRKTNSFYLNLMHGNLGRMTPEQFAQLKLPKDVLEKITQTVTVDMWVKRAYGYANDATASDKGTGAYSFQEGELISLAAELTEETGVEWLPHQVQAAMWSAAKARWENPRVKERVNAESIKKGFTKVDKDGNYKFPQSGEARRDHLAVWRKHAMKLAQSEVNAALDDAKFSYADGMNLLTNIVTWEAIPSTKLGHATDNMTAPERRAFTNAARQIITEDLETIENEVGTPLNYFRDSNGGYAGAIGPNVLTGIVPTKNAGAYSNTEARLWAKTLQYIFKQDAVPWIRLSPNASFDGDFKVQTKTKSGKNKGQWRTAKSFELQGDAEQYAGGLNGEFRIQGGEHSVGIRISFDNQLTLEHEQRFFDTVVDTLGPDVGYTKLDDNALLFTNFRDDETRLPFAMSDGAFIRGLTEIHNEQAEAFGVSTFELQGVAGEYGRTQDWGHDREGTQIIDSDDFAGRPDLRKWASDRRALFEELLAATDEAASRPNQSGPTTPGPTPAPIPLDRLEGDGASVEAILGRFGRLNEGQNTDDFLRLYDLTRLVENPEITDQLLKALDYNVKYFSFDENPETGVEFVLPRLQNDGYDNGTVWIYDPRNTEGAFNDVEYTRHWRISHELGHALTEKFMQAKYGDSNRYGRLGQSMVGQRGTADKRVDVELEALTLLEAQRAVEWEDVSFRAQRAILERTGVVLDNATFAQEYNVNVSDAVFRILTGEFASPGENGFTPYRFKPDLSSILGILEGTEQELANVQGRQPTQGVDLGTWKPVSDAEVNAVVEAQLNGQQLAPEFYAPNTSGSADAEGSLFQPSNGPGDGQPDQQSAGRQPVAVTRTGGRSLAASDFESDAAGFNTGNPGSGLGVWFTTDVSEQYGEVRENFELTLENPFEVNAEDLPGFDTIEDSRAFQEQFKAEGFDGVHISFQNLGVDRDHWIAFDASQVGFPDTFNQNDNANPPRGSISGLTDPNAPTVISLFESRDMSTFLHESGHLFLEMLRDSVRSGNAQEELIQDWETVRIWLGADTYFGLTVDQHEKFARGFEAYLMEGNAPLPALNRLFRKFRAWMMSVYQSADDLNVELSDEIRDVFDRMVAGDTAVNTAASEIQGAPLSSALGITPKRSQKLQKAAVEANEAALHEMEVKALKASDRAILREHNERLAVVRAEVEEESESNIVFQVVQYLRTGKRFDGTTPPGQRMYLDKTLLEDALLDMDFTLEEFNIEAGTGTYRVNGGTNPDMFAELFGFDSAPSMLQGIMMTPNRKDWIEDTARNRVRDELGDPINNGELKEEAVRAVHNTKKAKLIREELAALRELGAGGIVAPPAEVTKRIAQKVLGSLTVREAVKPERFLRAEAKALRASERAIADGNVVEAARQKRVQLLNHYLAREAMDAKDYVTKQRVYMKRFSKDSTRSSIDIKYLDQIDSLMERFDLRVRTGKQVERKQSLKQWVDDQIADGLEPAIDDKLLVETNRKHYTELTLEEFEGLRDAVKNIHTLGRKLKEAKMLITKIERKKLAGDLADHTRRRSGLNFRIGRTQFNEKFAQGIRDVANKYHAEHLRMEKMFQLLDGGIPGGPWSEAVFKPLADAEDAEFDRMRDMNELITPLMDLYTNKEKIKMRKAKLKVPGIPEPMTKEQMISAALNWGNDGNREALMRGFEWSPNQASSVLAQLDARDWVFVQGIWDSIDTLWPDIRELHRELAGVTPGRVDATPFLTPTGVEMRGGYYPLHYSSRTSQKAYDREQDQAVQEMYAFNFVRATTRKGHTQARVGSAGQEVDLSLNVIARHVQDVVHDLTHRKAIFDTDKILHEPEVEETIKATIGDPAYKLLRPWLASIAGSETVEPTGAIERVFRHLRHGTTVMNMGLKLTTMLVQPLGWTQTVVEIGVKDASKGVAQFYQNPLKRSEFILERSAFMRSRKQSFDRDVRDIVNKISKSTVGTVSDKITTFSLMGIQYFDLAVAMPSWLGAYGKGMRDFDNNETRAIAYADSIVRTSQGSGAPKDLANIQRGNEYKKLFTMFYSYFSTLYNLQFQSVKRTKTAKDLPRLFLDTMLLWFIPAVLGDYMLGRAPDEDEEEDFAWWAAKKTIAMPFMSMIGLRDIANTFESGFGYSMTPVAGTIDTMATAVQDGSDMELSERGLKNFVVGSGAALKLPTRQLWISGEYLFDWMNGDTDGFSMYELLVTGNREN